MRRDGGDDHRGFGCGSSAGRVGSPNGSRACQPTVQRPKVNLSSRVGCGVLTSAPGRGKIGVKWTYGGQVIDQPEKEVTYRDAAATSFNLVNSGGFPPGNYSVEVFVDGQSVGSRNFVVE